MVNCNSQHKKSLGEKRILFKYNSLTNVGKLPSGFTTEHMYLCYYFYQNEVTLSVSELTSETVLCLHLELFFIS